VPSGPGRPCTGQHRYPPQDALTIDCQPVTAAPPSACRRPFGLQEAFDPGALRLDLRPFALQSNAILTATKWKVLGPFLTRKTGWHVSGNRQVPGGMAAESDTVTEAPGTKVVSKSDAVNRARLGSATMPGRVTMQ